ncbi:MAG: hypothetical protein JWR21_3694 [Herminiimonas sp.]|nr:hypothetical protein [Herminiimonas sp.]
MPIPQRIFALWLQGEEKAPPLVKMCLLRWRRLNPNYELLVLDRTDAEEALRGFPLQCSQMPPQALSDVLRIKLLKEQGGVWVDATAFPIRPLDTWLPGAASSGFFAFRGHLRPIDVDSWFLAAAPGHIVPLLWWQEIERYWQKPRRLMMVSGDWNSNYHFDPLSFFRSDEGFFGSDEALLTPGSYPYYWLMYIFTYLLSVKPNFSQAWEKVEKRSGFECHVIQRFCNQNPDISDHELVRASLETCVQKLTFKTQHAQRWVSLDKAFADLDKMNGLDFQKYPCFDGKYSIFYQAAPRLYGIAKSAIPKPLRALGRRILRRS